MRVVPDFLGRPTLMSALQQPGSIMVWDERRRAQPVLEIHPPKNRGILSFDVSSDGHTLAAGTDLQYDDASIFYWDPRNPAQPTHTHSSTHSDDITTLHFHPTFPKLLLSASTDGLLSTSDAREQDEDEAAHDVANWGCSIARAGWFKRDAGYGVWASSDMETFGLWNDELDLLVEFGDVRQPSLVGQWTTDYLIDACDVVSSPGPCGSSGLTLFLGSNSGDVALASISDTSISRPAWTLHGLLQDAHPDAVVRSVHWDQANGVLITGDEAGRLAAWRGVAESDGDVEMASETEKVESGMKRGREDDEDQGMKRGRYDG
ncbi:WD40 repeat-like protein [Ramaria rubella]|nr:WD40 repeat-like protein [Ramaria rubella]